MSFALAVASVLMSLFVFGSAGSAPAVAAPDAVSGQFTLSGKVVDSGGTGLPGIRVKAMQGHAPPDPVYTDAQGNFLIRKLSQDTYILLFQDPAGKYSYAWLGGSAGILQSQRVTITGNQSGIVQKLQLGHAISGHVLSTDNTPIPNASVVLDSGGSSAGRTVTDSSGRFEFRGLRSAEGSIGRLSVSSASPVTIVRRVGWISGTVRDSLGQPAPGVCPAVNNAVSGCALSGSNGEYRRAISPGNWTIEYVYYAPESYRIAVVENEVVTGIDFTVSQRPLDRTAPSNLTIGSSSFDAKGGMHLASGIHQIQVSGCIGGATARLRGHGVSPAGSSTFTVELSETPANSGQYFGQLSTQYKTVSGPYVATVTIDCAGGSEISEGWVYIDRHLRIVDQYGQPVPGATVTVEIGVTEHGPWRQAQTFDAPYSPPLTLPLAKSDSAGNVVIEPLAGVLRFTATKSGCFPSTSYPWLHQLPLEPLVLVLPCGGISPNSGIDSDTGYWMLEADATVYGFGPAPGYGNVGGEGIALASTPVGTALWILKEDGVVSTRGGAQHHGNVDLGSLQGSEKLSAISVLPDGSGYWVFTNRGRSIAFGTAKHYGDMSGVALNGPVVASAATPSGLGYYMIGSDGGVFAFGDAKFAGSMGGISLNQPVVGIAPDPDNNGYWLVASDGGIFSFNATFRGSAGSLVLNAPVIGAVAYGDAYLLVAADGGIFNYSSSAFVGSLGANPPDTPIRDVASFFVGP